jgi:hypothetical protein
MTEFEIQLLSNLVEREHVQDNILAIPFPEAPMP